ncbi:MAG: energy transducer TonB [Chitinophagaceae bacterium]
MKSSLIYLLQLIIASGILYGYYHFFLRNKKFHLYNRYYLLAAVVSSIIIPFLQIPFYFTENEADSSSILKTLKTIYYSGSGDEVVVTASLHQPFFNQNFFLYLLYTLVATLLLARILMSLLKVKRIIRKNRSEELGDIRFINTTEPGTPFSFFHWLFWNKNIELQSEKGQQIFRHEIFHIQQKHSWDVLFIEFVSMILWINPFFYIIKKEIRAIHEFLADEFASKEEEKWEYAELLLMQALQTKQELVNPFFHNQIKRRIAMITNPQKTSHRYLRKLLALPLGVMITIMLAFTYKSEQANNDATTGIEKSLIDISSKIDSPPVKNSVTVVGDIKAVKAGTASAGKPTEVTVNGQKLMVKELKVEGLGDVKLEEVTLDIRGKLVDTPQSPLIVIDGVIQKNADWKNIEPNSIEAVSVLKDAGATLYGEAGKKGVIIITTKKNVSPALNEIVVTGYNRDSKLKEITFDKVETEASFPGGSTEWVRYLERNLNPNTPIINNAPAGAYTVFVQFIVKTDGSISDIKALTNHKYGMEEEAIRIIKNSPKWQPAIQNGQKVNSYKKQPVTFQVNRKGGPPEIKSSTLKEVVVVGYEEDKGRYTKLPNDAKPPSFIGGEKEWKTYLTKHVSPNVPVDNGAPQGVYTTQTQFLVNADGTISEIKSLTKMGYGMEEEAIRVIKSVAQWEPAVVNGEKVSAYKIQPVTFQLTAEPDEADITKSNADQSSTIYPNPSNNFVVVPFNSQFTGKGEIKITDINGNAKMTIPTSFTKGPANLRVDVASLAKGTYFISVINVIDPGKKLVRTYKMIKQ